MSGKASMGNLVALHTPQIISANVINPMMNLFFILNAIILLNILNFSLINQKCQTDLTISIINFEMNNSEITKLLRYYLRKKIIFSEKLITVRLSQVNLKF